MRHAPELFSLKGMTALITGATGHLGTSMAWALAESGAHVLVNGRNNEHVAALAERIIAGGRSAEAAVFDVTDEAAVRVYFELRAGRALNVLINNAYAGGSGPIAVTSTGPYRDSYEVSVVAAHNMLCLSLPCLRAAVAKDGGASVINVASMYALVSPDQRIYSTHAAINPPFYGAAKAGLIQWTRYAACEFGHEGIRVNSISPGPFPSEQVQENDPDFIQRLNAKVPMRRIGRAEEIRGPVLFLASPASSYVNGANLVVDGGWTSW